MQHSLWTWMLDSQAEGQSNESESSQKCYHHIYHRFPFPCYFSSWTSGAPHHPGFKFHIVALPLLWATSLVHLFFCTESTECFPGIVSRYIFSPLVTILVIPIITGIMKHFIFQICWISTLTFLYFNFFSASFCTAFLSNGIATSIYKQILSVFLLIFISDLYATTCLYTWIP